MAFGNGNPMDIDEDLHSRQLAAYGRETMRWLFASNVLVSGMQGLGVEIVLEIGKLLNVREASHKQIMENAEIHSIKQILGLQHGKQYDSVKTLRYGHLMIMTDQVDSVVYLVDAYDKERFAEAKKELDALLSNNSLANVSFLILGNKIDIPYAASEDELRYYLGLTGVTTGKGNVDLADSNVRPIEVFMCSIVRKMGYRDGFKWLS
ncbi:unnamed protein product [Camellia sinensis]